MTVNSLQFEVDRVSSPKSEDISASPATHIILRNTMRGVIMSPVKVEIGVRFGRLTVIAKAASRGDRRGRSVCLCDCGKTKVIMNQHLNRKPPATVSCGCVSIENAKKLEWHGTHGHSAGGKQSPTYYSWSAMTYRCSNPNHKYYSRYGGRGITVCDRWKSFENFLLDMGERPDGKTLDRIDGKKGYCPENCKWSTPKEQQRNRENNSLVTYKGKTFCVSEWAERIGMKCSTLRERFNRGWSIKDALIKPVKRVL